MDSACGGLEKCCGNGCFMECTSDLKEIGMYAFRYLVLSRVTIHYLDTWHHTSHLGLCLSMHFWQTTYEPGHEISNNVVWAISKGSDQPVHTQSDQSLC